MVNILEIHLHNCDFSFALSLWLKYSIILIFREVKKKKERIKDDEPLLINDNIVTSSAEKTVFSG